MVDKTTFILDKMLKTFDSNHVRGTAINFNHLMGYIEHAIKIKYLGESNTIAEASRKMNLNRTTLVEYFRKYNESPRIYLNKKVNEALESK